MLSGSDAGVASRAGHLCRLEAKSFYKRAVRYNLNASSAQNKLQRKFSMPKLATSREYKVQERES